MDWRREKEHCLFLQLKKRRRGYNSICGLIIDGVECTEPKRISKEVFSFYRSLYKSSYPEQSASSFFDKINNLIPVIDENFKGICDEKLAITEFDCAIKKMASGCSPGPDGITANFYKDFWEDIKLLLFEAINECVNQKELMETMKQGIIKLNPKPGKDEKLLSNLRPITLWNTDYKILTTVLATRLKTGISKLISSTQSGFLKGRSIHNNIHLVLDLIDYSHLIKEDGFMFFWISIKHLIWWNTHLLLTHWDTLVLEILSLIWLRCYKQISTAVFPSQKAHAPDLK